MGKLILVIDDDVDLLDIIQEALRYEGFDVVTSSDASDCQRLVRQHQADLVILDYLLKGINGGEICHQLKSNPESSHLPVIIFSAYPRVPQFLGDYGCNAFIPKPFDLSGIVGQISHLLKCPTNNVFTKLTI